jgi:hypothetical protein
LIELPKFVTRPLFRFCPFRDKLCIHPDWADCQFQYSGGEPEYAELWLRGEEGEANCPWLPKGISRTKMLAALGAYREQEKQRVLERINRGKRGEKKSQEDKCAS